MNQSRCIYREENADTHVEIWQDGETRSLWFDDVILQSEIHLEDPAVLPNPVNRAMLAHLMFGNTPEQVLLAGCGGGAIARWFNARLPATRGDAIELSPTVARLAREYFDFPHPDSRWRLHVMDIRRYLAESRRSYDFVLFDLEENQMTPDWATNHEFLKACRERTADSGTLTLNLITEDVRSSSQALLRIREVFDEGIALIENPEHDNLLVLCSPGGISDLPDKARCDQMGRRWGIDFARLAERVTLLPPSTAAAD